MNDLTWAIMLLACGLLLVFAEVFIPSGGLIGLLACGLILLSLYNAFRYSTYAGWMFVLTDVALLPAALMLAVMLWPRTPLGKATFLKPPDAEDLVESPGIGRLDHLVGEFGRTLTPLRPSGLVDFDGRRLDGLAEEGLIPSGTAVRAVRRQGAYLIVRPAQVEEIPGLSDPSLTA